MIKKILTNRLFQLTASALVLVGLVSQTKIIPNLFHNLSATAQAVGDLVIDWGVPAGQPIFTAGNILPGYKEIKKVKVTNEASVIRPVGVRGTKTSGTGDLDSVLEFTIAQNGTDLYGGGSGTGPKTLADFFTESTGPEGIPLSVINPGQTKQYIFQVFFPTDSGNDYQGGKVLFDIAIGIAIKVPNACNGIVFAGNPIFGTEGDDTIMGTPENDLVFGFEGRDRFETFGGSDCVVAGPGDDTLIGGEGNDFLIGDSGTDTIFGNAGTDYCEGEYEDSCEL